MLPQAMLPQAKISDDKRCADFFSLLDQYYHENTIAGMTVNDYVASFGSSAAMPRDASAAIAQAIRRETINSHWLHYSPKPVNTAFDNPPPPVNPDLDSVPPKRHFSLSLDQPGMTPNTAGEIINIFANAVAHGTLQKGTSFDINIPNNAKGTPIIDNAIGNFFRALATGHANALARQGSYNYFIIRFQPGTLNEDCIEIIADIFATMKFPETIQIRLSPRDLHLAAKLMYAHSEKQARFPRQLSIAFMEDRTAVGAISHKSLFATYVVESEPSSPAASISRSQSGMFGSPPIERKLTIEQAIAQKLMAYKSLYRTKLDSRSLEHQLTNLKLIQDSQTPQRFNF